MNGTTARWIVSGILFIGGVTALTLKKKKKPELKDYNNVCDDDDTNYLSELKRHIIIDAIRCNLQKEIPGWKQEDTPDEEKIEELSRLDTVGWGNITVSIVKNMSEECAKGTGSETSS